MIQIHLQYITSLMWLNLCFAFDGETCPILVGVKTYAIND